MSLEVLLCMFESEKEKSKGYTLKGSSFPLGTSMTTCQLRTILSIIPKMDFKQIVLEVIKFLEKSV